MSNENRIRRAPKLLSALVATALSVVVVVAGAQAGPVSAPVGVSYTVVDLGTLGGPISRATGINHPGVISAPSSGKTA